MGKGDPDRTENKRSEAGMAHAHRSAGSGSIRSEEHVGSPGGTGQRFKMPKNSEVADHSRVRGLK